MKRENEDQKRKPVLKIRKKGMKICNEERPIRITRYVRSGSECPEMKLSGAEMSGDESPEIDPLVRK